MGRVSNRGRILDSAVAVAEELGVRAVTIEAVATHAGLTKAGVQYHFSSKEQMMGAVEEHIFATADAAARRHLPVPFAEATRAQKIEAHLRGLLASAARVGELQLLIDAHRPESSPAAAQYFGAWLGPDWRELPMSTLLAVLAADGLWAQEAMGGWSFSGAEHDRMLEAIVALALQEWA